MTIYGHMTITGAINKMEYDHINCVLMNYILLSLPYFKKLSYKIDNNRHGALAMNKMKKTGNIFEIGYKLYKFCVIKTNFDIAFNFFFILVFNRSIF